MRRQFSEAARQAVKAAQEEARRLHHRFIGTEHLLYGLVVGGGLARDLLEERGLTAEDVRRELAELTGDALDADALAAVGIDLDAVRRAAEARFGAGALDSGRRRGVRQGHVPMTKRARKSVEQAALMAVALDQRVIDTGHLLVGLSGDGESLAARILSRGGVDLSDLRGEVLRALGRPAA